LKYNKPWIKANVNEIFTPRSIFLQRQTIIDEFGKLLGPLEPDIAISEKQSSSSQS